MVKPDGSIKYIAVIVLSADAVSHGVLFFL
jgi:hypothetical protein